MASPSVAPAADSDRWRGVSMPAPRHQRESCGRHARYGSEAAAWAAYLALLLANETDSGQDVYACRACGWWHHGGAPFRSLGRLLQESGWNDALVD